MINIFIIIFFHLTSDWNFCALKLMTFGTEVLFENISAHTSMKPESTVLQRVSVTMLPRVCAISSSLVPGEYAQHYSLQRYPL